MILNIPESGGDTHTKRDTHKSKRDIRYTHQGMFRGFGRCRSFCRYQYNINGNIYEKEVVTDNLDSKLKCSMVSLDLSKAFDTIDHNILINKLRNIGIRGVCLKLMKSYLFNKKQQVIFNNIISSLLQIKM